MAFKDRYDCECAKCGHRFSFSPSIMMMMGHNSGNGTCSACKTFLHLEIDEKDPDKGKSVIWDEHLKKLQESGV